MTLICHYLTFIQMTSTNSEMDGFSTHYKYVTIADTQCIEWTFPTLPGGSADNAERCRRRRIKDYVGLEHLNTPMVDSRVDKNGRNHCDIIVVTDHLSEWEVIMTDHYEGQGCVTSQKPLGTFGHQLAWTKDDNQMVSINFYPGKAKFMVQPGCRDPKRLHEWIAVFTNLKLKLPAETSVDTDDPREDTADADLPSVERNEPSAPPLDNSDDDIILPNTPLVPTAPVAIDDEDLAIHPVGQQDIIGSHHACVKCDDVNNRMLALVQTVDALRISVQSLASKLEKGTVTESTNLLNINTHLATENATLRNTISEMQDKMKSNAWKSFRNQDQTGDLLIGGSLLQDVDESKLDDTKVPFQMC